MSNLYWSLLMLFNLNDVSRKTKSHLTTTGKLIMGLIEAIKSASPPVGNGFLSLRKSDQSLIVSRPNPASFAHNFSPNSSL